MFKMDDMMLFTQQLSVCTEVNKVFTDFIFSKTKVFIIAVKSSVRTKEP